MSLDSVMACHPCKWNRDVVGTGVGIAVGAGRFSASLQEEKDVKVGEAMVWVENRVMPLPSPGSAMPSAGFRNSAVRKRENQVRL